LLALLKHIQTHGDFYQAMLGPKGDPRFVQRLRTNTERRFQYFFANLSRETAPDDPPVDLRINYISYAGVGAIKWWVEHPQACTAEQLTRWLKQLSSAITGIKWDDFRRQVNSPVDKAHALE
jgi:hypothetical protein